MNGYKQVKERESFESQVHELRGQLSQEVALTTDLYAKINALEAKINHLNEHIEVIEKSDLESIEALEKQVEELALLNKASFF